MARPTKEGLDYFPIDTDYFSDEKFQFLVAKCGLVSEAVCFRLLAKIYRHGYYTRWTEDDALLFSMNINIPVDNVSLIVKEATKRGLFDTGMLTEYSILTSKGIQKRYLKACADSRRINNSIEHRFNLVLVNSELSHVINEETDIKPGFTHNKHWLTHEESAQSKVKESKEEETKEKEIKGEENSTDLFLKQNNIFNKPNSDFLSSEEWFNIKAMQLDAKPDQILEASKEFIIDLRDRDILEGKDLIGLRSHFVSWFKKKPIKKESKNHYVPNVLDR